MIIHYLTPKHHLSTLGKSIKAGCIRKKYRLSLLNIRKCQYLPDITYYVESSTNDFVVDFININQILRKYRHIK